MSVRGRAAAALALAAVGGGCAWSNPDNRPVWNAFEEHLVPEDDVAFALTLPLTLPGGFGAILIDSLFVHPVQVVDDAARDARDLWEDMDWSAEYYTELAMLPLRGLGTPVVFVGSFFGRSVFDIDPHEKPASPEQLARVTERLQAERRREVERWLEALAAGRTETLHPPCADCSSWNDELQHAFETTRLSADAHGRLELYRRAEAERWPPWQADPAMGLRDPDPVVRYLVLRQWSAKAPVSDDLRDQLRSDPSEMVRLLARERFPASD